MWPVADKVRKYVEIHKLKWVLSIIFHSTSFYSKGTQTILQMMLLLLIPMIYHCKLLKKINIIPFLFFSDLDHNVSVGLAIRKCLALEFTFR
jgi:hypothetical protein